MTGLELLYWERKQSDWHWHWEGIRRALAGKADGFGKCPKCTGPKILFHVSTGDDEGTLCWRCWKKRS